MRTGHRIWRRAVATVSGGVVLSLAACSAVRAPGTRDGQRRTGGQHPRRPGVGHRLHRRPLRRPRPHLPAQWAGLGAAGIVHNPTSGPVGYRIYTAFLDPDGRTRGLVEADVRRVPAAGSKRWSSSLDLDSVDLRCVLRVERTPR